MKSIQILFKSYLLSISCHSTLAGKSLLSRHEAAYQATLSRTSASYQGSAIGKAKIESNTSWTSIENIDPIQSRKSIFDRCENSPRFIVNVGEEIGGFVIEGEDTLARQSLHDDHFVGLYGATYNRTSVAGNFPVRLLGERRTSLDSTSAKHDRLVTQAPTNSTFSSKYSVLGKRSRIFVNDHEETGKHDTNRESIDSSTFENKSNPNTGLSDGNSTEKSKMENPNITTRSQVLFSRLGLTEKERARSKSTGQATSASWSGNGKDSSMNNNFGKGKANSSGNGKGKGTNSNLNGKGKAKGESPIIEKSVFHKSKGKGATKNANKGKGTKGDGKGAFTNHGDDNNSDSDLGSDTVTNEIKADTKSQGKKKGNKSGNAANGKMSKGKKGSKSNGTASKEGNELHEVKGKGHGKGKGNSQAKGKGNSPGKGNENDISKGKGKGHAPGKGKGKGKGHVVGKGKGNMQGKGKGNILGKGKGQGNGNAGLQGKGGALSGHRMKEKGTKKDKGPTHSPTDTTEPTQPDADSPTEAPIALIIPEEPSALPRPMEPTRSPVTRAPQITPQTPDPVSAPEPSPVPAPILSPVPDNESPQPNQPTRAPSGAGEATDQFCVEYTTQQGSPDADQLREAGVLTCDHIERYVIDELDRNPSVDLVSTSCIPTSSSPGPPPTICFDFTITVSADSEFTPSTPDVDILVTVSLNLPTVSQLITALGLLPSSNPLSGTTQVTKVSHESGVTRFRIQANIPDGRSTTETPLKATISSLCMFAFFFGVAFRACRNDEKKHLHETEYDIDAFLEIDEPYYDPGSPEALQQPGIRQILYEV